MQERKGYTFLWGKRLSYIHISFTKQYVKSIHWKDWCWSWNSNTLGSWCEELTLWKDLDAGKDWGQEEKGTTEDEMVGWHHRHNGHGFGWTPGAGDGQGGLAYCSSWNHKALDMTEWLNWTEMNQQDNSILSDLVRGHDEPTFCIYRSRLCKLCHLMYSPLSQKLFNCVWSLMDRTALRVFWNAVPGL